MSRQTGIVAKWLNHRGIGFITPDGQDSEVGKDLLVHYSNVKQETADGFKSLAEGSAVEFETMEDPKNPGKMVATNVTGPDGVDCEKRSRKFIRRSDGEGGQQAPAGCQLFVGNLSEDTNWKELKDYFKQCGDVRRADVKNGFGIIRYANAEDAQSAIERLNGADFQGSALEVRLDKKAN
uniref:RRM domain-containing protein n=1 Tax=Trieres chinensis TaxID=1514140 RepID=A0A7S1ZB96_TRICV|mmetsp:Transcript_21610/g.43676  ORF Transcript_21610/g.43676 Transcript_21610/m.43676 type:complete len:180 (+) Transcript_21610:207-746(+)|eukprot:CAMPEP_0183292426 /NCGR_PEP_ID=MMETSP0160_2-20130417/1480_1 /TAXON_ID=2839 ORGANISM="Odontella Sinensis, Strain Grunow 1884" /NCGR_SAMPLE_ID=MMETSP0160_2 /ASSEMBLY_ACC=CAM_ASM_000250 /LENGTH=179 /DNA_ID=CAMNT_0025453373 /DNA_START=181 /DNA_END=720 /DNA_ORIENTATION=-